LWAITHEITNAGRGFPCISALIGASFDVLAILPWTIPLNVPNIHTMFCRFVRTRDPLELYDFNAFSHVRYVSECIAVHCAMTSIFSRGISFIALIDTLLSAQADRFLANQSTCEAHLAAEA
jgi:hypothetical protein